MTAGPKEWSPWYARWPQDIFESAARTLFVSAWADNEEREGRGYPGQDLMDVAPPTTEEARTAIAELFKSIETMNRKPVEDLYRQALINSRKDDTDHWRDRFGHDLALQAIGSGVGLSDDFEKHGVKVPYIEFLVF